MNKKRKTVTFSLRKGHRVDKNKKSKRKHQNEKFSNHVIQNESLVVRLDSKTIKEAVKQVDSPKSLAERKIWNSADRNSGNKPSADSNTSKHAFSPGNYAYSCAQTVWHSTQKTPTNAATLYPNYAKKQDAKNRATSAAKQLKPF